MKNDETTGMVFGLAIVGVAFAFAAAFVFAVLTFIAVILTIVAVFTWNSGITVGGWKLGAVWSQGFIVRGILGGIVLSAFAAFTSAIFGFEIKEDNWGYIFWSGYDIGSVVIGAAMLEAAIKQVEQAQEEAALLPPPPPVPPVHPQRSQEPAEPFRYADWDDEDEFK